MDNLEKKDFLESDPSIRGQNYVCMSFVSPDQVLKNKELFFIKNYLKNLINEKKIDLDEKYLNNIDDRYQDFLYANSEKLGEEFDKENEFKTSIRGVKVRGVYDTLAEAQSKSKSLQSTDKYFNVFVGQVGYWLPWDPHPHEIENQEYFESDLNNLGKKYRESQDSKEQHFRENIDYVKEQASATTSKIKEDNLNSSANEQENVEEQDNAVSETVSDTVNSLSESDPWMKKNLENN